MSDIIIGMTKMQCGECGIEFAVPDAFYNERKNDRPRLGWYCPNGHSRIFCEGESDKLRRERDRLVQRLAEKDDAIRQQREQREAAERRAAAARGQVTKIKNRVGRGVCPCCNRSFENLSRHMSSQHPTFTAEAAE